MQASDPYSLLYTEMIACFTRRKLIIVDWSDTSRSPQQDVLTEANLPELQLRPTGLTGNLGDSSSTSEVTATFQVMLNTCDNRLNTIAFPMQWEITKALMDMKFTALEQLKYNDRSFVLNTTINAVAMGLSDPVLNRGATGWSALWDISVLMSFDKGDLQ